MGERATLARVLVNLALVLKNRGRTDLALAHLDEVIRLLPRRGYARTRLLCHLNRGICLLRAGQLDNARTCFMNARALAHRMDHRLATIAVLNNLGHLYRMEGNHATAREFYKEALDLAEKENIPRKVCLSLEFLGETCLEEGRPTEAMSHLERAHGLAEQLAPRGDLMMEVLRRRGEARLALGQREGARHDLERAIVLCQARGERRELVLTQRAHVFAFGVDVEALAVSALEILNELRALGDRYEYARTVLLLLRDGRISPTSHEWLSEAITSALHYLSTMGISHKRELQRLAGHGMRIDSSTSDAPVIDSAAGSYPPSSSYARALEAARVAARGREPVLILGETGAGKEVIARLVHQWSARAGGPLVAINCGAIPENLIESELFGHVRGTFTGADRDRVGLLEGASGGSVLLDEVGDLPLQTQVKLLRFLDNYELRRLGDKEQRRVDLRVLAATNRDLRELVDKGRFRQDLFFRLNVFRIDVPPLRQRRDEIPGLVERFLVEDSQSTLPVKVAPDLIRWMQSHEWQGNVRELRNLCRYLSAKAWGKPEIGVEDLPADLSALCRTFLAGTPQGLFELEELDFERARILKALQQTGANITRAAELLGMGRNRLARKVREHRIDRQRIRDGLSGLSERP
jgi:DNA-binding NtrC family response regulator/Tfp pilus assembly protein PilF